MMNIKRRRVPNMGKGVFVCPSRVQFYERQIVLGKHADIEQLASG